MLPKLNRTTASCPLKHPVKVLQFGEGNFLRGFTDWIIDILNTETDFQGSVRVIQPLAAGMGKIINEQEGLYHVILNGIENGKLKKETKLITCIDSVINPYQDFNDYLKQGEIPTLQFIVSNTTEAGIEFNAKDITHTELAESFPGKLTSLLYHRYIHFNGAADKGLIFLPCELIDKNGENLRRVILQYIKHWNLSDSFQNWVEANCIFCNTLVDRIVPGFPRESIASIQQELGYEDNLVVTAELFHLWVIESPVPIEKLFPVNKTKLQVKFVSDLTPYRTRKVRILNGAHTSMVPVAYLNGLRTVQQAVEDPLTGSFIKQVIKNEIIPTLDLPEDELITFADDVIERFHNPFIKHELSSIALNSISKFKVRVLPSLLEYPIRKGKLPAGLVESLSKLILFYKREWNGEKLPVNDTAEIISFFNETWQKENPDVITRDVLSNTALWDQDLCQVQGLHDAVATTLKKLLKTEKVSQ